MGGGTIVPGSGSGPGKSWGLGGGKGGRGRGLIGACHMIGMDQGPGLVPACHVARIKARVGHTDKLSANMAHNRDIYQYVDGRPGRDE